MKPSTQFVIIATFAVVLALGAVITIFITLTPRSIIYRLSTAPNTTKHALYPTTTMTFSEAFTNLQFSKGMLRRIMSDLQIFTDTENNEDAKRIEILEAVQVEGQVLGMKDFIDVANEKSRQCFFVGGQGEDLLIIEAFNDNLQRRQTGILIFVQVNCNVVGYLLNNIWMNPRAITEISLTTDRLIEGPVVLWDLDGNHYTTTLCP